jgi:hypothetical protein
MGNLDPAGFLKAYGIDPKTPTKSRSDAYKIIKAEISKYSAGDLELKNMEHGFTGQTCYTPSIGEKRRWARPWLATRL